MAENASAMEVTRRSWLGGLAGLSASFAVGGCIGSDPNQLLNVSYDPTRELYAQYNVLFEKHWVAQGKPTPKVSQSHGGSGKQARAVIDGLPGDIVTLALGYDIDQIAAKGLLPKDWQKQFDNNSSPYTSTIVFLVRKGNPKGIKDWGDLAQDGVEIITPNPKTSGGARWNYLAAWGYELKRSGGDESKARNFVEAIYKRVPVLDSGARASTTTFVERKIGDVLLAWENEAFLAVNQLDDSEVEIVTPSASIMAEPPVAIVEKMALRRKTKPLAEAYLEHLYSEEAQALIAKHFYRPRLESAANQRLPKLDLFNIDDVFSGWSEAQPKHFADGGIFDKIYQPT